MTMDILISLTDIYRREMTRGNLVAVPVWYLLVMLTIIFSSREEEVQ